MIFFARNVFLVRGRKDFFVAGGQCFAMLDPRGKDFFCCYLLLD